MLLPSGSVYDQGEKEKINRYKTIVSYLEKNYMDKITLPDIAEKIGCTPQYMCQFFKSIAGVSPIQYLILFRIKEAKKMLKYSSHTVLEISMECGFENVSYSIRQFKKCAGMTPNQYRKNLCQ